MERISIFNYEAFYLDFLEGNLSEEDHALFLLFLEENPELKVVDEDLPALELEQPFMDDTFKNSLKQPLLSDKITNLNYEYFLISQAEGLLSEEKENEIDSFIAGNSELEKEKTLINSTYFSPEEKFVYLEKNSLKRKRAIILWPYYAVAASIMLAMLLWNFNRNDILENENVKFVEKDPVNPEIVKEVPGTDAKDNLQFAEKSFEEKTNVLTTKESVGSTAPTNKPNITDKINNNLSPRVPSANLISLENQKVEPIHIYPPDPNELVSEENNQDLASLEFSDMNNPIKPVTNFVGDKIKRTVDFRLKKKEAGKPSGFFLKIGKLEISRKRN